MNDGFLTATAEIEISTNVRDEVRICLSPQGKGTPLAREKPASLGDLLEVWVHVYVHIPLVLSYTIYFHFKWK